MKKIVPSLLLVCLSVACSTPEQNTADATNPTSEQENGKQEKYTDPKDLSQGDPLLRFPNAETYEWGQPCGYVNQQGDTIVPYGQYSLCLTDTVNTFALVALETKGPITLLAIDKKGNRLYEVYWYDNGPDYPQEGLFRILRNDLIGYADENGQIIIEPQFACAEPFSNGNARVAYSCNKGNPDGEYQEMQSDEWILIDKKGEKVNP